MPLSIPLAAALRRTAVALTAAAILLPAAPNARAEDPPKDFSPAERAIFMTDQFGKVKPPATLGYRFHRAGSLEAGFDDKVAIALKAQADGRCCQATGSFLSGERKLELPPVDGATGNPVTLFFLERDIREMERLTKGKAAYFRKRIRMAIFQGAAQRDLTVRYGGKPVAAQEFSITPYADDPNRPRFEQLANKRYAFTLSDAVPGGVVAIRSIVVDTAKGADAPPLLVDELVLDGADPGPMNRTP